MIYWDWLAGNRNTPPFANHPAGVIFLFFNKAYLNLNYAPMYNHLRNG